MKTPYTYRNCGTRFVATPVIFATVIFLGIRVADDIPKHSNYLNHDIASIAIELTTVLTMSALLYFILNLWSNKSRQQNRHIALEYAVVTILSLIVCLIAMYIIRLIAGVHLPMEEIPIPAVITILTTSCFYTLMRNRLTEQENEKQRLQLQLLENDHLQTELKLLRAQYHPHFLFNALNTIYFQIDESNPAPRHTIETLAELLRYQLNNDKGKVSLQTEIRHLQQFISLCKLRASKQLQLTMNFEEPQTDIQIYSMLLLPLVENAFKYVGGDYKISISLRVMKTSPYSRPNNLCFTVCNDTPKDIDTNLTANNKKHGMGLENLRRRLQLLYPNLHELILKHDNYVFCAILTIKFPEQ